MVEVKEGRRGSGGEAEESRGRRLEEAAEGVRSRDAGGVGSDGRRREELDRLSVRFGNVCEREAGRGVSSPATEVSGASSSPRPKPP